LDLAPGKQRLVGTVPTPEIEDPLAGLLPRGAVEEVLDARAQVPHHVPVVIAPDARLQAALAGSTLRLPSIRKLYRAHQRLLSQRLMNWSELVAHPRSPV